MVISVAGTTSPTRTKPYITPDMFRTHARAGVPTDNLVKGGTPADQEAALEELIEEAASWIDSHAEQSFFARLDTVTQQINVDSNGYTQVFPRFGPVIGVTAFSVGPYPENVTALESLAGVGVTENSFTVPVWNRGMLTSSQGPIQFGGVSAPANGAWATYSYVPGYPVARLTAPLEASDTLVSVDDTTGFVAGQTWVTLRAGRYRFKSLVTSVSTADAGGLGFGAGDVGISAIPWAVPNPSIPIQLDALPSTLITANVLVTRALIKQKPSFTPKGGKKGGEVAGDDFAEAWDIISKFLHVAES